MPQNGDRIVVVPHSRVKGIAVAIIGIAAVGFAPLLRACLGDGSYLIELQIAGIVGIGFGLVEIFRRDHAFAITTDGFDDNSLGGVGAVGWTEILQFKVIKLPLVHGSEVVVFKPENPAIFWGTRHNLSAMAARVFASTLYAGNVAIAWYPIEKSPSELADFLNQLRIKYRTPN